MLQKANENFSAVSFNFSMSSHRVLKHFRQPRGSDSQKRYQSMRYVKKTCNWVSHIRERISV